MSAEDFWLKNSDQQVSKTSAKVDDYFLWSRMIMSISIDTQRLD
jgi:hypothetical protein